MDKNDSMTRAEAFRYLDRHGISWGGAHDILARAADGGRVEMTLLDVVHEAGRYAILLHSEAVNRAAQFKPAEDADDQPSVRMGGMEIFVWRQEDGTLGVNVLRSGARREDWPRDTAEGYMPRHAGEPVPVTLYLDSNAVWSSDGAAAVRAG